MQGYFLTIKNIFGKQSINFKFKVNFDENKSITKYYLP